MLSLGAVTASWMPIGLHANGRRPEIIRGFQVAALESESSVEELTSSIVEASTWGVNAVRLQLKPVTFAKRCGSEFWLAWPRFLDRLNALLKNIEKLDLKVVLVLMEGPPVRGADQGSYWKNPEFAISFCAMWRDISNCIGSLRGIIWAYDLLNEPLDRIQLPSPPVEWRSVALSAIREIRDVDPSSWIVFEPGPGSLFSGFAHLEPLPLDRIIYSAHFYYPQDFTHQGISDIVGTDLARPAPNHKVNYPGYVSGRYYNRNALAAILEPAKAFQRKWQVPIFVGEFSVVRWAPKEDAVRWLEDVLSLFEELGWSWTYHAFREFNGWNLELDGVSPSDTNTSSPSGRDTARALVIRNALSLNKAR